MEHQPGDQSVHPGTSQSGRGLERHRGKAGAQGPGGQLLCPGQGGRTVGNHQESVAVQDEEIQRAAPQTVSRARQFRPAAGWLIQPTPDRYGAKLPR